MTEIMATILLIDEDEDTLDRYQKPLRARDHVVYCAASGAVGLLFAEHYSFDVVVCDMLLPDMNGFEMLRNIKTMKPCQKVMITSFGGSYGLSNVLEMAAQAGADATYNKKDGLDLLTLRVEQLVMRVQHSRSLLRA